MSSHRLDTEKLMRAVEQRRGDRSYRQVAAEIGVGSMIFVRLRNGDRPDADSLLSLMAWLDPKARFADYTLLEPGRRSAGRRFRETAPAMS